MPSKSLDKLAGLAENFDKKAQANTEMDNLSLALSALFSIAARMEQQGLTTSELGKMIAQSNKLRPTNPQDLATAKQMVGVVKPISNYIAQFADNLKKV